MTGRRSTADRVAAGAGLVAVGAMLVTPAASCGGRARRVLTTITVGAGFVRSVAIDIGAHGVGRGGGAAAATVGMTALVEHAGVRSGRLFGRYRYTDALRPQMAGVPVVVPLAWAAMAPPSHASAAGALGRRSTPLARVAVGAVALTAWDLFLDPQMTREGYWRWLRPGSYRGVPLRNFVGWLAVSSALMAMRDVVVGPADDRHAAHVTTYGTVAVMETVAFATFFRDRLVAVAGGAPMLALAGVAARQRRGTASARVS